VNSFLETLKNLGPSRLAMMGGILLALITFLIFISMRVSSPDFSLLYSDLSSGDITAVSAQLDQSQIPYELSEDRTSILVPESDVARSRMLLAESGLPNGGSVGYELFDNQSGFGTTNDIINLNKVRALEGELSRTIISLAPIKTARVHLVLPQRELFSREKMKASASVAIGLRSGGNLNQDQVFAIQSLVAASVPELKATKVAVIDQNGKLLARGDDEELTQASLKAEEMRLNYEQRMTRSVEDLIGRIVGYGKVRATVTADLNFDRVSTNEEVYDPATQVVRSTQSVEENNVEREASENNVSVENNLPASGNDLFLGDNPALESSRLEETTNFEISRTTRNIIKETGEVRRLSVAVLVDGKYSENADGARTYEPRTEAELDQIAALVRSAIGFDSVRGDTLEVINLQFADIEVSDTPFDNTLFGFDKNRLLDAAEIITVAIMFILIVLLVIQPMVGKLLTVERKAGEEDEELETSLLGSSPKMALEGPSDEFEPEQLSEDDEGDLIDMKSVEGKVKASSIKKVEDIVENFPDETVSVIRSWMTQD
tara:strand:+ start:90 stop:1730 length:1641 start_codon:yes stop_codon:yes gene_type:complete